MLQAVADVDPALIDDALKEILESQFFRSSAQCSALFRYIVKNTLSERDECLRERVIGSEVFGRAPDYDTGNDHVVRSRASEVRKRLAQFYQEQHTSAAVRISIPSGSYRATFEVICIDRSLEVQMVAAGMKATVESSYLTEATAATELATDGAFLQSAGEGKPALENNVSGFSGSLGVRQTRRTVIVTLLLAIAVVAVGAGNRWLSAQDDFQRFWSPMVLSPKPVIIYCGGAFVYKLSDQFLDNYRRNHQIKGDRREFFVDLQRDEAVQGEDLIPDRHFVPFGDLASAARVASTLSKSNKAYDLRYGDDVAFTELRSSPVILIGGLNNSWALRVTKNLRFVLEEDDRIVDRWHPERTWVQKADADSQTRDDYAVISRLSESETGGFILSIAGIRMYGTRAAADLVGDPIALKRLLKDAPKGWQSKNLQILIHTRALNDIPVSVNIESVYYW